MVKRHRIAWPIVLALAFVGLAVGAMPGLAAGRSERRVVRHRGRSAPVRHRHRPTAARRRATATQAQGVTADAANASSEPSGVAMPVGNIPGWHEVFRDDFTGNSLDSQWTAYWGVPGGDPGGFFDPTHVTVSGGRLAIAAYKDPSDDAWDAGPNTYVTGGVSSSPSFAQTYGKYLVRFKFGAGAGISHAILLWPQSNTWPPEIDFSEDNGANRQTDYATLHYGADNTQVQKHMSVDLTQWHTLGVEWTPGRLVYTLDGRDWATVTGGEVPSTPMTLDIQTQAWACGTSTWEQCPNATTPSHVNLSVDWVVAYAPASGSDSPDTR